MYTSYYTVHVTEGEDSAWSLCRQAIAKVGNHMQGAAVSPCIARLLGCTQREGRNCAANGWRGDNRFHACKFVVMLTSKN